MSKANSKSSSEQARNLLKIIFIATSFITAAVMMSCASSSIVASWHDQSYIDKGILNDVLIIAVTNDETVRRLYEDGFVAQLSSEGARAVPSYSLSDPDLEPTKESIEAAVKESGAQSVLITRHLSTDTKEHYRPPQVHYVHDDPFYRGIHRYYPMAYRQVYTPGYNVKVTTVSLESNLYDANNGNLVWTTRSESVDPAMTKKFVDELIGLFKADLKKNNLL